MTVPWGDYPDGTFDDDLSGLDGLDEATWRSQKLGTLSGFDDMHAGLKPTIDNAANVPDLVDGQAALETRTDLLDTGYCHLIQSKNWNCPSGGTAKKLPFDVQVGPGKFAVPSANGIRLQKKGLWQASGLILWEKTTYNGITGEPNYLNTAQVLAVHKVSDNSLYTRKHYYYTVLGTVDPTSMAWSHEFVVPDDDAYDVSIWVGYTTGGPTPRKLFGGIQYTKLSVIQQSHSTANIQPGYGDPITEGGPL